MRKLILILILLVSSQFLVFSQKYRDLIVNIDSTNFGRENHFSIEVTLIKKRGKKKIINKESSKMDWKKVIVKTSELLSFDHGVCRYKARKVNRQNRNCTIEITDKDGGNLKTITINLPYVKEIILNNQQLIANRSVKLDYNLKFSNGVISPNRLALFDFSTISVASINNVVRDSAGGFLTLELDKPYPYKQIRICFIHVNNGDVLCCKTLDINYPSTVQFNFSGWSGKSGRSGSDGSSPSGNGSSGENGEDGGSANSAKLFVRQEIVNGDIFLVIKTFLISGKKFNDVLLYNNTPIKIFASGGEGGNGGSGGNGANGLIDKENNIDSPQGGKGGDGGRGGNGGDGGNVIVYLHESAYTYANNFQFSGQGGTPGHPGEFGKGGKGDYTNRKLLGTLLSVERGEDGRSAADGSPGRTGILELEKVSDADFNTILQQHIEKGY